MPRPYSALLQRLETSWTLTTALLCGLLLPLMSSSVQAQTGTFLDSCDSSSPYTCFGYDTDAIINSTSVVTIANCEFIGCPEVYALSPMNFINVTFTSSTYQYSDAVPGGGAIRIMADVSISNSTFHSCQAASSSHAFGGAIYVESGATLTGQNLNFLNNQVSYRGGAIAIQSGGVANLTNIVFESNSAPNSRGSDIFVNGGTLYWTGGSSTGIGGSFPISTVQASSGGSVGLANGGQATISNVAFSDAVISFNGGAVMADSASQVLLTDITINNTYSLRTGALSAWSGSNITCVRCSITNSYVGSIGNAQGSATYASAATLNLYDSVITNGTNIDSKTQGGCHADQNGAVVTFQNVSISGCVITGYDVSDNSYAARGGAIFSQANPLTLSNVTVANSVAEYGGGLYSYGQAVINLLNVVFSNNNADIEGGAIFLYMDTGSSVSANGVSFYNNTAANAASVLDVAPVVGSTGTSATFTNLLIQGNSGGSSEINVYTGATVGLNNAQFDCSAQGVSDSSSISSTSAIITTDGTASFSSSNLQCLAIATTTTSTTLSSSATSTMPVSSTSSSSTSSSMAATTTTDAYIVSSSTTITSVSSTSAAPSSSSTSSTTTADAYVVSSSTTITSVSSTSAAPSSSSTSATTTTDAYIVSSSTTITSASSTSAATSSSSTSATTTTDEYSVSSSTTTAISISSSPTSTLTSASTVATTTSTASYSASSSTTTTVASSSVSSTPYSSTSVVISSITSAAPTSSSTAIGYSVSSTSTASSSATSSISTSTLVSSSSSIVMTTSSSSTSTVAPTPSNASNTPAPSSTPSSSTAVIAGSVSGAVVASGGLAALAIFSAMKKRRAAAAVASTSFNAI